MNKVFKICIKVFVFIFLAVNESECQKITDFNTSAQFASDIIVDINGIKSPVDSLFFGVCPMFWSETDSAMADGKIEQYLADMKCRFLRFPGGTESDNFIWSTNRLHDSRRWPHLDGPDKMNTDEFIALCQRLKAQPIICVNTEIAVIGNDYSKAAKLAADWVKYCNIEKGYKVKYWEIGNEPYYHYRLTPAEYARLLITMAREMKKADPDILIAAVGEWNYKYTGVKEMVAPENRALGVQMEWSVETGDKQYTRNQLNAITNYKNGHQWWPEVLRIAGEYIDVASIHWYFSESELTSMTESLGKLTDLIRQNIKDHQVELIMTEWSLHEFVQKSGMERALMVAEAVGRSIDGGVTKSTYWPLRCGGTHDKKGLLDMSEAKKTHANYDVLKLFAQNIGNERISSISKNTELYHFATFNKEKNEVQLFLVNRCNEMITKSISFTGMGFSTGISKMLDSQGRKSNDRPVYTENKVSYDGKQMKVTLPAYSIVVYVFKINSF